MIILAIETSCDESAISLVKAKGNYSRPHFSVLGQEISSQVSLHAPFGGVVPMLAKREHQKNLPILLEKILLNTKQKSRENLSQPNASLKKKINKILEREPELREIFWSKIISWPKPKIDAIAVTQGPGLEPALWVGINFARALALWWEIPLIPTNHLEGHIYSGLVEEKNKMNFPALALVISGGHTELILVKDWRNYKILGQTRDDAIGEAFDKVARLLGLPYPGGPEVSKLAQIARKESLLRKSVLSPHKSAFNLPRPMIGSSDLDFSFSGLKTAVLYLIKKISPLDDIKKKMLALDFENSVVEVIIAKTKKALAKTRAKMIVVGGGVIANTEIRNNLIKLAQETKTPLILPPLSLTGDNATMIGIAGFIKYREQLKSKKKLPVSIKADGNLKLGH